jgi:SET domain-containing protein
MPTITKRVFKPSNYQLRVGKSRTGKGMFAAEDIPKGACIIEYIGRPATKEQMRKNTGKYLFWLDEAETEMIDGNIAANKARFINHSCQPNCEVDQDGKRIFIFAIKNIKAGEELNYDYGPEYFEMYFSNGRCQCDYSLAQIAKLKK